jgi:hypothetical protein
MNADSQELSRCNALYTIVPGLLCTPLAELTDAAFQLAVAELDKYKKAKRVSTLTRVSHHSIETREERKISPEY